MKSKALQRNRRHKRIRAKLNGTAAIPRFSVYKSNRFMHIQLIDDKGGRTIVGLLSKGINGNNKLEQAKKAGEQIAELAKKAKIERVRFDRGGFIYAGRVRAVAEGAREAGLKF